MIESNFTLANGKNILVKRKESDCFEYPIVKRSKRDGKIVRFFSLNGAEYENGKIYRYTVKPHTDDTIWENLSLENERAAITKELVELHYFFMHQMLKENKIKRLNTYADWMYSICGNLLNSTLYDHCRILKQNIEDFSLKNNRLLKRTDKLFWRVFNVKTELYKLSPNQRGVLINKDWAKMFSGKHRKVFDRAFKSTQKLN